MKIALFVVIGLLSIILAFYACIGFMGLFHFLILDNNEGAIGAGMVMVASLPHMVIFGLIIGFKRSLLKLKTIKIAAIPFILVLLSDVTTLISQFIIYYT